MSMDEILKISRRGCQVRSGRDKIRLLVPETLNFENVCVRTRVRSKSGWKGSLWVRAKIKSQSLKSFEVVLPTVPKTFSLTRTWPSTNVLTISKNSNDLSLNSNVWDLLRELKALMLAKETVHLCYVKVGHLLKLEAKHFLDDKRFFDLYKSNVLRLLEDRSASKIMLRNAYLRKEMFLDFHAPYNAGITYTKTNEQGTTYQFSKRAR